MMASDAVSTQEQIETWGRQLSPEQAAAAAMVAHARQQGLELTDPDGLLKLFTKNVLVTALNEEMTKHLGHQKNQAGVERAERDARSVGQDRAFRPLFSAGLPAIVRPPRPRRAPW